MSFSGLTFGQYYPGGSLLHRLDPRTKVLAALLYAIVLFLTVSPAGLGLLAAALVAGLAAARVPSGWVWRSVKPLFFLVLLAFALQLFVRSGSAYWQAGPLTIYQESAWAGGILVARLLLLALSGSLLVFTTPPVLLADGVSRLLAPLAWLRLPVYDLALMMTIALRFVPQLLMELDRIAKAQAARGADPRRGGPLRRFRNLMPVLVPLLVTSFRQADELALAMESRCWRGGRARTVRRRLRFGLIDAAFAAAIIMVMIVVIIL